MSNKGSERKRNKEKNKLLIAEVKKQQAIYGWTYEEMEKKIGVPKSTISAFMCGARDGNEVKQREIPYNAKIAETTTLSVKAADKETVESTRKELKETLTPPKPKR